MIQQIKLSIRAKAIRQISKATYGFLTGACCLLANNNAFTQTVAANASQQQNPTPLKSFQGYSYIDTLIFTFYCGSSGIAIRRCVGVLKACRKAMTASTSCLDKFNFFNNGECMGLVFSSIFTCLCIGAGLPRL